MGYIKPEGMRSVIRQDAGVLTITIPVKRNWFAFLFLFFWICGWAFGEVMATKHLFGDKTPGEAKLFLLAWLGGWTVAGAFSIHAWLWQLSGREIIKLTTTTLNRRRALYGFGKTNEYGLPHVRNLRVAYDSAAADDFWRLSGGAIAFDYGAKTYRFGIGLDEVEAQEIVRRVKELVRIPG